MLRFNIALIPVDQSLRDELQLLAQSYFSATQDGYILASDALPHVTLCQFRAQDQQSALDLFHSFGARKNEGLTLKDFRLRKGTAPHAGFLWAEFPVEKSRSLIDLQRDCFFHLKDGKVEVLTPVETYSPHVTLARLAREPDRVPSGLHRLHQKPVPFSLAIGVSSENGVFIREL
jgi:2'-5' RNA ligase